MNMKRNILIVLATIAFVLPSLALNNENLNTLPEVSFQSTSTMTPVGSTYSSNPALNDDGTAYSPSQASSPARAGSGPRKIGPGVSETIDEKDKVPIGDGTWILMLLAVGYAFFIAWRRMVAKR